MASETARYEDEWTHLVTAGDRLTWDGARCECGTFPPPKRTPDVWLEVRVADDWVVAYRLIEQAGRPVIGEVRIFPFEGDDPNAPREPGEWSAESLGKNAPVPPGGLRSAVVREARLSTHYNHVRDLGPSFGKYGGTDGEVVFRDHLFVNNANSVPRSKGGRLRRSDVVLADVAVRYENTVAGGSHKPIVDLTAQYAALGQHLAESTVRDLVHKARDKGFLAGTVRGRAGGHATKAALDLLVSISVDSSNSSTSGE